MSRQPSREPYVWRALALVVLVLAACALLYLHSTIASANAWNPLHHEVSREEFHWHGAVTRGGTVTVNGVNGPIDVHLVSGSDLAVDAVKTGRRSDPREVRIEVARHGADVVICAVYPGRGNGCDADGHYSSNLHHNDVSVAFDVQI